MITEVPKKAILANEWSFRRSLLIQVLDVSKIDRGIPCKVIKKRFVQALLPSQIPAIQKFFSKGNNKWCSWLSGPQIRSLNISSQIENNQLKVMCMQRSNCYENWAFADLDACIAFFQQFYPKQIQEMQDHLPNEILAGLSPIWAGLM